MPFDPDLQARIDRIRGRASDMSGETGRLRAKLAARRGVPGYSTNVAEIGQRLSEMSGGSQENDNGEG